MSIESTKQDVTVTEQADILAEAQDLGCALDITGVWADGPNRDGGWVTGNNYSYE